MGRAGIGLGQSESGEWATAASAGLCHRSAATRPRIQGCAGRGVAADAEISGALTLLQILSGGDAWDSIELARLSGQAVTQSEMPFDQIFRERIPQRERAVKKTPRPVWGYRPG